MDYIQVKPFNETHFYTLLMKILEQTKKKKRTHQLARLISAKGTKNLFIFSNF